MMRYVRAAVTVLAGVLLILFALANREVVEISFWPLPIVLQLPLYAMVMVALALGALIGGFVVGMRSLARRREAGRLKRRLSMLEQQIAMRQKQEEEAAQAARPAPTRALTVDTARG